MFQTMVSILGYIEFVFNEFKNIQCSIRNFSFNIAINIKHIRNYRKFYIGI